MFIPKTYIMYIKYTSIKIIKKRFYILSAHAHSHTETHICTQSFMILNSYPIGYSYIISNQFLEMWVTNATFTTTNVNENN